LAPSNPLWGVQPLDAYASSSSVPAGGTITFHTSVTDDSSGLPIDLTVYRYDQVTFGPENPFGRVAAEIYTSDYREMLSVDANQVPMHQASLAAVSYQTPADASKTGCNWPPAHEWHVPAALGSGVFLARLTRGVDQSYVLFVVRPAVAGTSSRILCQLSYNTYQAYNPWMGSCFYDQPISDSSIDQVSFDRPCHLWDFLLYEQPLIAWLEQNYVVEFCTNVDLHADPGLLQPYNLLVSCGHDEYWSAKMRDRVEDFCAAGGNTLFLSGNTCYRPVDFDPRLRTMTRLADTWQTLGRWEGETTGVNFSAGRWSETLPPAGFAVRRPQHWVFAGTGLNEGEPLGHADGVIGYETDAAPFVDDSGYPLATGADRTPSDFAVLATADLTQAPQRWGDLPGYSTLGFYRRGRGIVMTVGSTGWGQGLLQSSGNVHLVTRNMIDRLQNRTVVVGGELYAIAVDGNLLFYRDRNQDGTGDVANPQVIAHGGWDAFKFVTAGGNGIIYAVTGDGRLLFYRDQNQNGTGEVANPQVIGHGGWDAFKFVTAGGNGIIYAVTADGRLLFYRDQNQDGTGEVANPQVIGHGGWDAFKFVTAGGNGIIYTITADGRLLFYRDQNQDGTGDVTRPQTIGRSGWESILAVCSNAV
jgi:hypothetical protein